MSVLIGQTCPVCRGRGSMPRGFYLSQILNCTSNATAEEPCRSCNGAGIITMKVENGGEWVAVPGRRPLIGIDLSEEAAKR